MVLPRNTIRGSVGQNDFALREGRMCRYGDRWVAERVADVLVNFQYLLSTAAVNVAASGLATAIAQNGALQMTAPSAEVTVTSRQSIRYTPGFDNYCYFAAALASQQDAEASIGPTDFDNGFFLRSKDSFLEFVHVSGSVETVQKITGDLPSGLATVDGIDFDPTKKNIYCITYGLAAPAYLELLTDNGWVVIRKFNFINRQTGQPTLQSQQPITAKIISNGGLASLNTASWCGGRVGAVGHLSSDVAWSADVEGVSPATPANLPILAVRSKLTFAGQPNRVESDFKYLNITWDANKSAKFSFVTDVTIVGGAWSDLVADSTLEINTTGTSFTGGRERFDPRLSFLDSKFFQIDFMKFKLLPGEEAVVALTSGANATLAYSANMGGHELF